MDPRLVRLIKYRLLSFQDRKFIAQDSNRPYMLVFLAEVLDGIAQRTEPVIMV